MVTTATAGGASDSSRSFSWATVLNCWTAWPVLSRQLHHDHALSNTAHVVKFTAISKRASSVSTITVTQRQQQHHQQCTEQVHRRPLLGHGAPVDQLSGDLLPRDLDSFELSISYTVAQVVSSRTPLTSPVSWAIQ